MTVHSITEHVYHLVTRDDGTHNCDSLTADACIHVPQNFMLNIISGNPAKLAQQLAGPNFILPWFLAVLGAPTALIGLLLPAHRLGILLPQLVVSGQIHRIRQRKWLWTWAAVARTAIILLMIPAALLLPPHGVGMAIIGLMVLWGMAGGTGAIAIMDLIAKTIPRGQRGILLASRTIVGGGLTLVAGLLLRNYVPDSTSITPFIIILAVAAGLWFVSALVVSRIIEEDSATGQTHSALKEALAGIKLIRERPNFRRYLLGRNLLLSIELSVPFYALLAKQAVGDEAGSLGLMVIMVGLAEVLSSVVWGYLSDRSSSRTMGLSGALAALTGAAALLLGTMPVQWYTVYLYGIIFLMVGFARSGIMLARVTYIIDGTPEHERSLYVALTNILMGLVTIAGSVFAVIGQLFGIPSVIFLLLIFTLAGTGVSLRLPAADHLAEGKLAAAAGD